MTELPHLFSQVVRAFWRDRVYSGALVLIVGLGIGGNAAILATLRATVLQQLPFERADQLVRLRDTGLLSRLAGSGGRVAWLQHVSSLQSAAVYAAGDVNVFVGGRAERLKGAQVSPSFFQTLGVVPLLGPGLLVSARAPATPATAPASSSYIVVSHRFWTQRLEESRALDELAVTVNGNPVTVVGVMPPTFRFPDGVDLWFPDTVGGDTLFRGARFYQTVGRLADHSSLPKLTQELETLRKAHLKEAPQLMPVVALPLHDALLGRLSRPLFAIASSGAALLVLVVFNIASLTLARTVARSREFAIKAALGESRGRALASIAGEALMLAALGLAIAWPLGHYGIVALRHAVPLPLQEYRAITFDSVTILAATASCLLVALGIGAVPTLIGSRQLRVHETLVAASTTTTGASSLRSMRTLVCVQFALTIPLMVAAALLARSLANIVTTDPGFRRAELVTVDVALSTAYYTTPARVVEYYGRLMSGLRNVPGIAVVGAVNYLPLSGTPSIAISFEPTARQTAAEAPPMAGFRVVAGQYLEAIGLMARRGRLFFADEAAARPAAPRPSEERRTPVDPGQAPAGRVAPIVVNESFARAYWPGVDPIGQTLTLPGDPEGRVFKVIGEVADLRHQSLKQPGGPEVFLLHADMPSPFMSVVVRSRLSASTLAPALSAVARDVDVAQPLSLPRRITDVVADTYRLEESTTILVTGFALVACVLSFVGVFSLVTRFVHSRLPDLAMRAVLGASPTAVRAFVASHLLWPLIVGVAIGAALAAALVRTLNSIVFGVNTADLTVLLGVPIAVLVVGGITLLGATRRAARYDSLALLLRR